MKRVGQPPIGEEPRQLIAIRLDSRVLATFRKEAKRRGVDYQTLMNEVLAKQPSETWPDMRSMDALCRDVTRRMESASGRISVPRVVGLNRLYD